MKDKILEVLEINFRIVNPFNYLTKAEVIDLIPNDWNPLIKETKTCSKMPGTEAFQNFNGKGYNHCGICTACILRQISILNSKKYGMDVDYILPDEILSYKKIIKYETDNGDTSNPTNIQKYSSYRYIEKNSLIQYYTLYKNSIENGTIYKYLNLNPKYFLEDKNYIKKYDRMLTKFALEIDSYLKRMK